MTSSDKGKTKAAPADHLSDFSRAILKAAGADEATARDATRAMLHASIHGIDSHGVRLLPHYQAALRGGRLNGRPQVTFTRIKPGTGMLDADHAHGARAMYEAVERGAELAGETGIAAVAVSNSSHFGAAGAYTLELAGRGLGGMVFGNSDSLVRLHDGAKRFHGTNPISVAFPTAGNSWLLDMATSSIPWNRVQLYRSTGTTLPTGIASNAAGRDVDDPREAEMLAPLGGEFGFKGAGLAGVAEIFSAVMTGMKISPDLMSMDDPDLSTPRRLGAFIIAFDPAAFVTGAVFSTGMEHYLASLRDSPPRDGARVLAPGDREWQEAERRRSQGIPLDPATIDAFKHLESTTGIRLQTAPE
ncbi:MAG: Ldh family oxidoreductase [Pseudomonadota bacterium]|nr:Ldh family oxidoreductase [Pseudomonadota bacterium]